MDDLEKTNPAMPLEVPTEPTLEDIIDSSIAKESASKKKTREEMIEGVEKSIASLFGGPVRVTKVRPGSNGGFEFEVHVESDPTEETHTVIVKDPPKLP